MLFKNVTMKYSLRLFEKANTFDVWTNKIPQIMMIFFNTVKIRNV